MKAVTRITLLLLLAALLAGSTANAEVGVIRPHDASDRPRPYTTTVFDVVDEPDPFGIWARHSPTSDTRRAVLNPGGNVTGDGWPAVIYHAQWQRPLVAWSTMIEGSSRIVMSEFINDAWTAARPVTLPAWDQYDPVLTEDPSGMLILTYWATNGIERIVFTQYLLTPDDTFSAPLQVSRSGELAARPTLALYGGGFKYAYEVDPEDGTGNKSILLAEWTGDGFDHSLIVTTAHPDPLWPQLHSRNGKLWLDWIDFTNGSPFEGEMAWLEFTETGWSPISYEIFTGEEELDYHVRGAIKMQVIAPDPDPDNEPGGTTSETNPPASP